MRWLLLLVAHACADEPACAEGPSLSSIAHSTNEAYIKKVTRGKSKEFKPFSPLVLPTSREISALLMISARSTYDLGEVDL